VIIGKLIKKFQAILDVDRKKQKDKRDKIRGLLKRLKKKERTLEAKLQRESDSTARKRLKRDLKVLYAQRKKGVKLCRELGCKK
jgi:hypothetical protein